MTDSNKGYIQRDIGGSWLTGGHANVCILKLNPPTEDEFKNDGSRSINISMITRLLDVAASDGGLLQKEYSDQPTIVLAPELAFGSPDFDTIDSLVNNYCHDIIFICGFGFTSGSALTELVTKKNAKGVWHTSPSDYKKYNGGWVWVKNSNEIQRYIFLKNFFEQSAEISIPNLKSGNKILRLEANDIVIFPLICADLIYTESESPKNRIVNSLTENSASNKKVLITGSLLNKNSASGHWKAAIGDLLEAIKLSNARLLLSNCLNPSPKRDENEDKWRCLSGAFQHRQGCKPPVSALPNLRYVEDTKFTGLVVRNSEFGAIFGKLGWTNNASEGLHAFSECSQYMWVNQDFELCDGNCAADELYRFIMRNNGKILHDKISSNSKTKSLSNTELKKLLVELHPSSSSFLRSEAGRLFQKCLKGIKQEAQLCPDQLHNYSNSLDCAITTLKLVQSAVEAELMPKSKELGYGQLLLADKEHEILVWDSIERTAKQLYIMTQDNIVKEGGSARPLMIIGRGNGGGTLPVDGRVRSNRLADISNAPPLNSDNAISVDRDICEANDRVVFWKNQGRIDEILSSTDPNQDLVGSLREEINSLGNS